MKSPAKRLCRSSVLTTMITKLGIYLHIPFCNGKCAYCDFVSGVHPAAKREAYFLSLEKEINTFDFSDYETDSVYFGGGTPSSVDAKYVGRAIDTLRKRASFAPDCEISIECNPESFTEDKAKQYAISGINRISFGLQSANDALLKEMGRLHSTSDFIKAAAVAGKYFSNISADVMLGLPNQTDHDVVHAIDTVLPYVRHISVYSLKVEQGTPLAARGYLPDDDMSADFYDIACKKLTENGLDRYEVSNFALPGYECRHNKKYWSLDDYAGFGVAAHSYFGGSREENTPVLEDYINGVTRLTANKIERGSLEDIEEFIMLALRTTDGIDLEKFYARFGYRLEDEKKQALIQMSGLIKMMNNRLTLTDKGFYLMNSIIVELL